jgi:hypothetical protein
MGLPTHYSSKTFTLYHLSKCVQWAFCVRRFAVYVLNETHENKKGKAGCEIKTRRDASVRTRNKKEGKSGPPPPKKIPHLDTDGVDSLAFAGIRLAALKDMAEVAAAIVAADFALGANAHVGRATVAIITFGVGVPTLVSEFARRRVQRVVAGLARKVAVLWEVAAELALAIRLGAGLAQYAELLRRQLGAPLGVCQLERVRRHVWGAIGRHRLAHAPCGRKAGEAGYSRATTTQENYRQKKVGTT